MTLICDGLGNCNGPVVDCTGVGPCNATSKFCCRRLVAGTPTLTCDSSTCGTAADLGLGQYGENCKGTADCPIGNVCCERAVYGFLWLECAPPTCDQFQVCKTQTDCITGTCTFDSNLKFSTCQ
jgi:hypothetical protein